MRALSLAFKALCEAVFKQIDQDGNGIITPSESGDPQCGEFCRLSKARGSFKAEIYHEVKPKTHVLLAFSIG